VVAKAQKLTMRVRSLLPSYASWSTFFAKMGLRPMTSKKRQP